MRIPGGRLPPRLVAQGGPFRVGDLHRIKTAVTLQLALPLFLRNSLTVHNDWRPLPGLSLMHRGIRNPVPLLCPCTRTGFVQRQRTGRTARLSILYLGKGEGGRAALFEARGASRGRLVVCHIASAMRGDAPPLATAAASQFAQDTLAHAPGRPPSYATVCSAQSGEFTSEAKGKATQLLYSCCFCGFAAAAAAAAAAVVVVVNIVVVNAVVVVVVVA